MYFFVRSLWLRGISKAGEIERRSEASVSDLRAKKRTGNMIK